ncbi:MAG: DUF7351 domain-containing protein [Halobacteriota archaeon]
MTGTQPAGDAGVISPEEAFAILGNEARTDILLALWEAGKARGRPRSVPFTELFDRSGYETSSNFSYHLNQLQARFVTKGDDGYRLTMAGLYVVRSVILAGMMTNRNTSAELPAECPLCGSAVRMEHEGFVAKVRCTRCLGRPRSSMGRGYLLSIILSPAGVVDRSLEEAFEVGIARMIHLIDQLNRGLCYFCNGAVDATVDACVDHGGGPETVCEACGRTVACEVLFHCIRCGGGMVVPAHLVVTTLPQVRAIRFAEDPTHDPASWSTVCRSFDIQVHPLALDPVRLRAEVPTAGKRIVITLDEHLEVTGGPPRAVADGGRPDG